MNLVLIASETGTSKQDFDNMLDFERDLFEELIRCIQFSYKKINEVMNGKLEEFSKNEMISFIENVEEFIGFDGEVVGPFKIGDFVILPKEITKILIESGKAKLI